ncbi:alpha/beta hydrolase [Ruminococcaceae bacterium OttesenSCG-928-D13]|nr:alpha/beta hydrolase [Ruminococcaceae bacterium OttesenSCG-928-D13]
MKGLEVIVKMPEGERKGAVVFLHGACHAAWCWEYFLDYFPQYGYESCALSLPGHGKSWGHEDLNAIRFSDYTAAVREVLNHYGGEAVLVGHSLGGSIAQKVLADNSGVAKAGVLMATGIATWLPGAMQETMKAMTKPQFRQVAGMMSKSIPESPEVIRDSGFFSGRISPEDAKKWRALLRTEPPNAIEMKLSVDWKAIEVPMLVIASDMDVCSTLQHQDKIAVCYGTKPVVLEGICHDMMLDPEWETAAKVILKFMNTTVFV